MATIANENKYQTFYDVETHVYSEFNQMTLQLLNLAIIYT